MTKLAKALQILLWVVLFVNIAAFFALPSVMGGKFGAGSREFWLALGVYYPCGIATAIMIRQGEKVLAKVASGRPFHTDNYKAIRNAAFCCFAVSVFTFVRAVIWLCWHRDLRWLFQTYNTFFVGMFFVAGLFAMVLSELFRTAADLQADNDLVI